jgi:hypothetical protein
MATLVMDAQLSRRNRRAAWALAAFVLLVFASAVPFWTGLFRLMTAAGGG